MERNLLARRSAVEEEDILVNDTVTIPDSVRRLAARIRRARAYKGWSLRNLAEYAGLNHESVRRIESGQTDPRWSVVTRLAKVLDITERELQQIMLGQKTKKTGNARAARKTQ